MWPNVLLGSLNALPPCPTPVQVNAVAAQAECCPPLVAARVVEWALVSAEHKGAVAAVADALVRAAGPAGAELLASTELDAAIQHAGAQVAAPMRSFLYRVADGWRALAAVRLLAPVLPRKILKKKQRARAWLAESWTADAPAFIEITLFGEIQKEKQEEKTYLPKDGLPETCALTGVKFETAWSDEHEAWCYVDAIQPAGPGGPVFLERAWRAANE